MKILYLVNKNYYNTKMSRIRFNTWEAIEEKCDVSYISGPNWEEWDNSKTVQENVDIIEKISEIEFDAILAYKPLEMKEFKKLNKFKILRYNEMWDEKHTVNEIEKSGAHLVICHHKNDFIQYLHNDKLNVKFEYLPHSANERYFNFDETIKKDIDVLFVGAVCEHYPLRTRLLNLLKKFPSTVKVGWFRHPGGSHDDAHTDKYVKEYANAIKKSKIVLTCSSKYKYRLGKYVEIPMCGTLIAGDLPFEDKDLFKNFVIDINNNMTDDTIIKEVIDVLNDKQMYNVMQINGLTYAEKFTCEKYAERFINIVKGNMI